MADDVDEGRIKLRIDLATGALELEAPSGQFESALQQVQVLAEALELKGARSGARGLPSGHTPDVVQPVANQSSPPIIASPTPARSRTKTGKSTGRPGRIGSFDEIRGLLTEEQEMELRAFMAEKSPKEQPDQVLVAMVKGEQVLSRKGLSYNEIYTLMWLSGIKDLPKALDVVLLRLIQDQMATRDEAGFVVKFVGRNRVENELPRKGD